MPVESRSMFITFHLFSAVTLLSKTIQAGNCNSLNRQPRSEETKLVRDWTLDQPSASTDSDCFTYRFPQGIRNPCADYKCAFQAWCVPSQDFKRPTCVCYNTCYDVGDSTDKGPVCGSNGQEYASVCHLRREACTMMVDIEIKYRGKC
ncbi:uncharacterized protein DEA37_0013985, partial [Paragonimus westermani]